MSTQIVPSGGACRPEPACAQADQNAPDYSQAAAFLRVLDESADAFEFRTFDDSDEKRPELARKLSGSFDEVAGELARLNQDGAGVFVVVNEGGQTADSITRVRAVFADTDGAPLEPILECGLEPHIVVESSPGRWHAYWPTDDLPLDQFTLVQKAIAARFGTDPNVSDLPRVMRLPGFYHRKGEPFRTRIIHESGAQPYSAERILRAFPPLPYATPSASTPRASTGLLSPNPAPLAHGVALALSVSPETVADLRSALAHLRADDRGEWIAVGAALRELGNVGRGLWLEWSQMSEKWKPQDAQTWDALSHDRTGYAAIFARAQAAGWVNPRSRAVRADVSERFADFMAEPAAGAVAESPRTPLRLVPADGFDAATLSPTKYAVEKVAPCGNLTLFGGHGGTGKSTLACVLGAHKSCGRPWAGLEAPQGRVLFVSLEDPADLVRYRLRAICEEYGLPADVVARNFTILDGTDGECALAFEAMVGGRNVVMLTEAMRQLREVASGHDLIIVDNASDAFDGNENDRRQVRTFVRALAKAGRDAGAAVVLLAHIDKAAARHGSAGNTFSGSTAWHNSARSRLALVESDGVLELRHEKANLSAKVETIRLRMTDAGVPVPLSANAAAAASGADDFALLECMRSAIERGVVIGTGRAGPGNTHSLCKTLPGFPVTLDQSRKFWTALARLEAAGSIVRESYTTDTRKARERWAIPAAAQLRRFAPGSGTGTNRA